MAKLVEKIVPTWIAEEGDEYIPVYDPAIDGESIELVRCKDCMHAEHCEIYAGWDGQHLDWYCADGKRKEGR